jgi:hypothetical protein
MPKLREDLLKGLTPNDEALMKILRKRPLKAYTIKELLQLLPSKLLFAEVILDVQISSLISRNLVMKIIDPSDGQVYYAKSQRRVLSKKLRSP